MEIAPGVRIGPDLPPVLIAGPCVIESQDHCLKMARSIRAEAESRGIPYIFKASYDKANRTSVRSFRGPGLQEGLRILQTVKTEIGVPVLSDVHEVSQVEPAAEVLDVLQIPAFLCRQTDLIAAVAGTGRVVNIKKGQFLAPQDLRHVVEKARSSGAERVLVTERGTSFGYHNLVVDFRSLPILRGFGCPVIFDASHSVQLPAGQGEASGGHPEYIPVLARAAVAVGVDGIFIEVHDRPGEALSDGPNALPLDRLPAFLDDILALHQVGIRRNRQC
ncbi:MAG: 3-deoxy-8-phosphooctulonate synthase [Acidobacteriota bacterium]